VLPTLAVLETYQFLRLLELSPVLRMAKSIIAGRKEAAIDHISEWESQYRGMSKRGLKLPS
jgi:hypothetical protein